MSEISNPSPIHLLAGDPGARRAGRDPLVVRALASCCVAEPRIAYIGAASGDDRRFFTMIANYLEYCGAGGVTLAPLAGRRAKLDETRRILEAADMIFVSGGDVEEGMEVLGERGIMPFLRGLRAKGKPFFGLSAGSIMLARQWVRWEDPGDDSTAEIFPCMALADVLIDTHGEDEEWEELRALLALAGEGSVGYGIPAGGGMRVEPNGAVRALGKPLCAFEARRGAIARCAEIRPEDA